MEVMFDIIDVMNSLSHSFARQLSNPQVQRITWSWHISAKISKIRFSTWTIHKGSFISFGYPNPVVSTWAATSTSTNHKHCTVPWTPVTPEPDCLGVLYLSTACRLLETASWLVLSAILYIARPQALVWSPDYAIPEVTIARDFRTDCLSTQTVTRGLHQSCMLWVITTSDLELFSAYHPESWRHHVSIDRRITCVPSSVALVIPPVSTIIHPIFGIIVWKSSDQCPTLAIWRHIAIYLTKIKWGSRFKRRRSNSALCT